MVNQENIRNKLSNYYLKHLDRKLDESGFLHYLSLVKSGKINEDELESKIKNSREYKGIQLVKHGCVYTIFGTKMYLNNSDRFLSKQLGQFYNWAEKETLLLSTIIKNKMNVIDIGANIGFYTVLFSKWVGIKGKVWAFEPEPNNFNILSRNVIANQVKNANIYQKAILNYSGKTSLFLNRVNPGGHSVIDFHATDGDEKRKKIVVECNKLNEIISSEVDVDFIKNGH